MDVLNVMGCARNTWEGKTVPYLKNKKLIVVGGTMLQFIFNKVGEDGYEKVYNLLLPIEKLNIAKTNIKSQKQ